MHSGSHSIDSEVQGVYIYGVNLLHDQRESPEFSIECDGTINIKTGTTVVGGATLVSSVSCQVIAFASASNISAPRFVAVFFRCENSSAKCARSLEVGSEIARNCRCRAAVPPSTSERVPRERCYSVTVVLARERERESKRKIRKVHLHPGF